MENTERITLEELRNPEKRAVHEENSTVKALQKELQSAITEARDCIDSFKSDSNNCNQEFFFLKETQEKEINSIIPNVEAEVERLIDCLRNEMVSQTSENLKLHKQVQGLQKETSIILQIANEAMWRFNKAESSMELK